MQDPYAVFRLEDATTKVLARGLTGVVRKGGKDPLWTVADNPMVQMTFTTTPAAGLALQVRRVVARAPLTACPHRTVPLC